MGDPQSSTTRLRVGSCFESFLKEVKSSHSTCLSMLMKSKGSAMSTIGMARANLTCTTSWTSSMLLAWTSPRRPPSNTDKLTMLRRNSANSMRLYPLSNKPSRSQNTLVTTMTTLSCANCTTKMKMEPWCWLSLKLSCLLWVMKSPRMIVPSFWMNWQELRMRMVSSPTLPSWTNCAASKCTIKESPPKRLVDFFIEQHHFKQLKTCVITSSTQMGVENPTLKLTPMITNTNIFVGTKHYPFKMAC